MKHSKKRFPAYVLLSALLLSASLLSCGDGSAAQSADTAPVSETATADTVETEEEKIVYKANVPDKDFGGEEFHVLTPSPDEYPSCLLNFDFEEDSGDIVESAIYQRNRKIEETYNVKFVSEYAPDWDTPRQILTKCVQAGDDAYQLIMVICRDAFPLAVDGSIFRAEDIPYVDITQPWYIHNINEQMSVCGETMLAYTDECMNAYMQTIAVFFNKQLVNDNDLSDPYTLVREGKWTLESFYNMCNEVATDIDGDGKFSEGDVFGICSEGDMFIPSMWIGANISTVEKDADGVPVYTAVSNEKLIGVLDTLTENMKKDGFYMSSGDYFGSGEECRNGAVEYFASNKALFRVGNIGVINTLRSMEADFGVLPLPKYDEAQEEYYCRMIDGWIHVAPITVQNKELLGTMIEALGAESKNYVIPAFFDVALTSKLTRDTESEEMLNIIFNNVTVDLGDTVWYSTIRLPIEQLVSAKKGSYASALLKKEKSVNKVIDKAIQALTE